MLQVAERSTKGMCLKGYHATRLAESEQDEIRSGGLEVLSVALVKRRLAAAKASGQLTDSQHCTLLAHTTARGSSLIRSIWAGSSLSNKDFCASLASDNLSLTQGIPHRPICALEPSVATNPKTMQTTKLSRNPVTLGTSFRPLEIRQLLQSTGCHPMQNLVHGQFDLSLIKALKSGSSWSSSSATGSGWAEEGRQSTAVSL